jgi:invasion protein IalB
MTIRTVSALARPVRWSLVTTVAAAFAVLCVPAAQAQSPAPATKPKPDAKPKTPAAAPKQPAAQPAPAQPPAQPQQPPPQQQAGPTPVQMPNFIYSPWTKVCAMPPPPNTKQVCFTSKDAFTEQGIPMVQAELVEMDGEPMKFLRITVPFGMAVSQGTQLQVDQNPPQQMPFMSCAGVRPPSLGCFTQYPATPELVAQLKKGQTLFVRAINLQNQLFNFPLALADFAKANEGPATDPKAYEDQQKKMQEDLLKKAEELRKQQQGAPAAPK